MKYLQLLLHVPLVVLLNACSTTPANQGGGAYYDQNTNYGALGSPSQPASPSMRPGMNPEDPRDPQYITRPQPLEPPPTTKP